MRPEPYVGITGVTSRHHALSIINYLPRVPPVLVMIGVLASRKSIHGLPVDQPKRYPAKEALGSIFFPHPQVMNILHFNTNERGKLLQDLELALEIAGPHCQGFQLNMAWPEIEPLKEYKEAHPTHTLILQCGKKAISKDEDSLMSPKELAERVEAYRSITDYVLIDPSGGQGIAFNFVTVLEYFDALEKIPDMGFGIAGGLGLKTTHRLRPLWEKHHDFSVDAESGVRDERDEYSEWRGATFLAASAKIFSIRKQRSAA